MRANGSIRVTQLVGLYSGDHRSGNLFTPERTSDEHTRLFKPPGMDEQHLRPQFRAPSASSIYSSFIGAIRRSLAFSLGQQPGWVLFGGDSCLNEGTIGFKTMSDPRFTEIVSFTCRWTATGALIIQSLSNDIAKVHRISDLYPPDEIEKSYGQVVLAFPQQAVGTVVGRFSPKKRGHEVSMDSMHQAYTKDCLQGLNVSIEAWDSWIRIHTSEADIDIGLTGGSEGLPQRRNLEIIWPSKLCLCTTPRHMLESLKRTLNPDSDIMDPIERAEAWFNHSVHSAKADGETGKADIVTADRKDTEDANNTMTKEQLSPLGQRNLFDSSTVYPTPPDGVQSYSHNTPMPENALEGVDERNTAAFRANARQNVPPENQDLFGEHEMDLTEADFEFFDEPGFQNQPTVSDRSYLKGKVQLSGDVDLTGGPSIPTIPDANSNVQAQSQDRKVDVVLEDEIMRDIATLATPVSMLTVENSSPQACKDDVQVNNLKRRHEPDAEPETTASESSTPSDFSVAVSGRADMDLDTKYSERGPYGYVPSRVSSSSHQTPINRSTKQILPQMGLAEGSISDSDESDGKCRCTWYSHSLMLTHVLLGSKASMSGSFNWLKEYEVDISPEPSSPASSENDEATKRQHVDHVTLKTSVQTIWPFIQQSWIASQNFGSPANKQIITAEGKETIELAQIVIDHAITTLSYEDPLLELFQDVPEIQGPIGARHLDLISKLIGQFLSPADAKPLREVMVTGAARTTASSEHVREPADLLELPNVNLRRMNVSLSVLPSAVMFWEELGLEPLNCQKHVLSLCLSVRKRLYLQRPIGAFLEQMRDVYQGCQLGHHEAISDQEHFQNVLDEDGPGKLGSALGQHGSKELFYVIYLLNEVAQPAPLALCEMCQEIMDGYRNEPGRSTSFGLVVQIVPLRMVYDSRCPAIPPVDVLRKLALEVYDRCGPVNESASFDLAPAVALSQPLPDKIDFQLTADSSAVKLFHDNCLHIAYLWEPTCQWMTVTWVDNTGNLQWNASYWVGEDEKTWQEFGSAVYEIIETTGLMIGSSGLPRRIFVVKQNRFLREELKGMSIRDFHTIYLTLSNTV